MPVKQNNNFLRFNCMRLALLFVTSFCIQLASHAQSGRQHLPLYEVGRDFRAGGWHFAPGLTYMMPSAYRRDAERLVPTDNGAETLYNGTFEANGGLGIYLELGKQHFFRQSWLIDYIDFGLHFKQFRGRERFNGVYNNQTSLLSVSHEGKFNDSYAGIYFNANHIAQVSDRTFLQFSLGLNADYRVLSNIQYSGLADIMEPEYPSNFIGQMHAKLGFGWRPEPGIFIIPSIETPILNLFPGDDGKSTLPWFNSRYRPIIFSVRVLFFGRTRVADCVGSGAGNEKRGHELWGEDMRKKKSKKKKRKKR